MRNRTSALISTDTGESILIDTTPDLRHQALQFQISRVDAVLFTHSHADHIFGLDDIRGFNFSSGKCIPCYGTHQTLEEIRLRFGYIFEKGGSYEGGALPKVELKQIEEGSFFHAAGVEILPFSVLHGQMKVTGFKIGGLAYATDCNNIPLESKGYLRNIEVLIIDGLRYTPHFTHFTVPEAITIAREMSAKKTFLTHMCHSIDYNVVSAKLPEGVYLAYDGLEVEFS